MKSNILYRNLQQSCSTLFYYHPAVERDAVALLGLDVDEGAAVVEHLDPIRIEILVVLHTDLYPPWTVFLHVLLVTADGCHEIQSLAAPVWYAEEKNSPSKASRSWTDIL